MFACWQQQLHVELVWASAHVPDKAGTGYNPMRWSQPGKVCTRPLSFPQKFYRPLQNHRNTECSGSEGTSRYHLVQPPCWSRVTYSRLHRTLSRRVLNISREGDSTTSLGNLFQGFVTLRVKKFFLMFRRSFLCFNLCPLPLVLLLSCPLVVGFGASLDFGVLFFSIFFPACRLSSAFVICIQEYKRVFHFPD